MSDVLLSDMVEFGMPTPYETWPGLQSHPLGLEALKLREAYRKPCRLSPLIAMSDPVRTSDVRDWAKNLPEHCAVIYRFDTFDEKLAKGLRDITKKKSQQFLIRSETHSRFTEGQHFKRHTETDLINTVRQKKPDSLLTLAAIKEGDYTSPLPDIDGLLVSAIFPSKSPSAGTPIGIEALKKRTKQWDAPVFALGGINIKTVSKLRDTQIAGIAAVGALNYN